jgi:hypothetical protein
MCSEQPLIAKHDSVSDGFEKRFFASITVIGSSISSQHLNLHGHTKEEKKVKRITKQF